MTEQIMTSFAPVGTMPLECVLEGSKTWRLVASVDERGRLTGEWMARLPDRKIVMGVLEEYRYARQHVPREMFLTLRRLKNTFAAEQAGMAGNA